MRHELLATIIAAILLALPASADPPAGRPPTGPLERYESRIYDVQFEIQVSTAQHVIATERRIYKLDDAPIGMPFIFQSTFSEIDASSLNAQLWLNNHEDQSVMQRSRIDDGQLHHTHLAVFTTPQFAGQVVRWQMSFRTMVWSSRITNEEAAASIPWPKEFPDEVQAGLKPQRFIESDNPLFKQAIDNVTEGKLRLVPPYIAAKEIVRYCINNIRVARSGEIRGDVIIATEQPDDVPAPTSGALRGMRVQGAVATAREQMGSPHDLVCVCVAMLRAAGIPARPVIGIEERANRTTGQQQTGFVSWLEFYLPDAGWIPVDPDELRGAGLQNKTARQPWKGFGNNDDLNRRIPLSFSFIPPSLQSPMAPAVWGWDPRPGGDPGSDQIVRPQITSRGRAQQQQRR